MQSKLSHPVWRLVFCFAFALATAGTSRLKADVHPQLFLTDCLQQTFLGCNVVRIDKFSVSDEPKKSAELSLDNGQATFNAFGDLKEPDRLEGFSVGIALEMMRAEDPLKKGRQLYSITPTNPPEELQQQLGKNQLRLVWTPSTTDRPGSIRLLLVSPDNKVLQTLDLRQNGT